MRLTGLALLTVAIFSVSIGVQAETTVLLRNVKLIDVGAGTVSSAQDVLLRNGRIEDVGPNLSLNPGAQVFDGDDSYAIPGLWDSHVHVFSSKDEPDSALKLYLINGVTGVRDMGALLPLAEQQRIVAAVENGERPGPRIVLSGAWVDAPPGSWPGMFLAATPDEARARVSEINAQGWAAVKAYSMLEADTYRALADAAHAVKLPLVGHIPEGVSLSDALDAKQDGMEHFGRVTKACSTEEEVMIERVRAALSADDPRSAMIAEMQTHNRTVLETWDEEVCEAILGRMAAAGMAISPTLIVSDFYTGVRPNANALRMRMLPSAVRQQWAQPDFRLEAMTDELRALADKSIALDWRTFHLAHDAGVPMLASTDASYANPFIFHGFSLLDELDRYVEIGLTPREALLTATVAPAVFFKLADQDGTIAPGRRADILLLEKNPLDGLATLREPLAVIAHGRMYDRKALQVMADELLSQAD